MMDTNTSNIEEEPSELRAPSTYARFFKSRSNARKIRKRISLPAQVTSNLRRSDDSQKEQEGKASEFAHNQYEIRDVRTPAADANNFKSPKHSKPIYHQRSRSTSALVVSRPRYDDERLKPVPPRVYMMNSVARSSSSYASYGAGFSPDSVHIRQPLPHASSARSDHSIFNAAGPRFAQQQQAQRPPSVPNAFMGNYAQIDAQATRYQRRPSNSSVSTVSTTFDTILASPPSSRTSSESWRSQPRNSQYGWQRPAPIKQYRQRRGQGEMLAALPDEVLGLILDKLKESHLSPSSDSCATCMMRDLCSVAMSARKLLRVARVALYEDVQLVGADSTTQKRGYKISFGSRLILLRRTLRSTPNIAVLVRALKPPALPQGVPMDEYRDLVASVVMACPNLERLVGLHPKYDFSFTRFFHALSTRGNLKEMSWVLETPLSQKKKWRMSNAAPMLSSDKPNYQDAPGDLQPEHSDLFLELHAEWTNLRSLSIHCLPGATLTPISLLPDILSHMPKLESLHLSHLPFTAFNDANLLSLPPLRSFTLSHLPGISSDGLSSFARRPSSQSIRTLSLVHVDVDSLPTLGQILSNLNSLKSLTFVQNVAPQLPTNEVIWLFPYLASSSLRDLHWDVVLTPSSSSSSLPISSPADSVLAKSIAANGFPALRSLRTPNDPDGIFQALCKPIDRVELANEKQRGLVAQCTSVATTPSQASPTTPPSLGTPVAPTIPKKASSFPIVSASSTKSARLTKMGEYPFPPIPNRAVEKFSSNLAYSRRAAQARLEAAREKPRFDVNVIDEDGTIVDSFGLGAFLGEVGSPVIYRLDADVGARDENGGVVDVAVDVLLADSTADEYGGSGKGDVPVDKCNGRWNSFYYSTFEESGKGRGKGEERWWHTERGRWRVVDLE